MGRYKQIRQTNEINGAKKQFKIFTANRWRLDEKRGACGLGSGARARKDRANRRESDGLAWVRRGTREKRAGIEISKVCFVKNDRNGIIFVKNVKNS